jgi:hypothetical protein
MASVPTATAATSSTTRRSPTSAAIPPAAPGFNLLTWSQGEVRHTILSHDNKANPEATPRAPARALRRRCILETEYSFRATARATAKAPFGITSARRADAARKQLEKIQALAPTPELAADRSPWPGPPGCA